MFEFPENDHILLSIDGTDLSGSDLAHLIELKQKTYKSLRPGLIALKGHATFEFVTSLLVLLNLKIPVAVVSPTLTPSEWNTYTAVLAPLTELNESGDPIKEHEGIAKVHPHTALLLMTSGSTGHPRAVQLSWQNIQSNLKAVIHSLSFASAPEQVLFLPLSYSFGLLGQLLPALRLGVRTTLLNGFSAAPPWIAKNGLKGMWSGVPSQWIALLHLLQSQSDLEIDPSHIISAGGRLDLSVRRRLVETFSRAAIFNNYGLTEASPRLLCLPHHSKWFLSEAVGFPVGDWQIQWSEDGELLARGSQVMLGYLNSASGAERVFDGWLSTGDVGKTQDDGCVFLQGRIDHLVKVAGERMSLTEIEMVLAEMPAIRSACVIPRPHPVNENSLEAYLELNHPISKAEILTFLRSRLSPHKIPQHLKHLPALPLNANGKIDRKALEGLRDRAKSLE